MASVRDVEPGRRGSELSEVVMLAELTLRCQGERSGSCRLGDVLGDALSAARPNSSASAGLSRPIRSIVDDLAGRNAQRAGMVADRAGLGVATDESSSSPRTRTPADLRRQLALAKRCALERSGVVDRADPTVEVECVGGLEQGLPPGTADGQDEYAWPSSEGEVEAGDGVLERQSQLWRGGQRRVEHEAGVGPPRSHLPTELIGPFRIALIGQ